MLASTFHLGEAMLGIETLLVQEIIALFDATPVRGAPDYVLGIVNLRGRIVTIIDLGRKLGLPSSARTDQSRVIIVNWSGEEVGLFVDGVSDVIEVNQNRLLPPPSSVSGAQARYFTGVHSADGRLVAVLDLGEVLAIEEQPGAL